MRRAHVLLLLALLVLPVSAGCGGSGGDVGSGGNDGGEPAGTPLGPLELVEELRRGGYVLFLRHAATDMSQEDTNKTDVSACPGMRNLVARGRNQARALGRAFRALEIPVGEVRASAYCRTRETAQLAFGRYVRDETLTGFPDPDDERYDERLSGVRALLAGPPAGRGNLVLVGHVKTLEAVASLTIEEGELAVFEPDGGGFRYRGRIPASAWPYLEEQLRPGS